MGIKVIPCLLTILLTFAFPATPGGICFRFDDNQTVEHWRDLLEVFDRHEAPLCMSINFNEPMPQDFIRLLKEAQAKGHEIMDHSPNHTVTWVRCRNRSDFERWRNSGAVDHVEGETLYFKIEVDPTKKFGNATVAMGGNTLVPEPSESNLFGNAASIYDPETKTPYAVQRDPSGRYRLTTAWGEDRVNLKERTRAAIVILNPLRAFSIPAEALRIQAALTRRIARESELDPPVTWIQPGQGRPTAIEPFLGAGFVKSVLGQEFGYLSAAVYPDPARKQIGERDPDGTKAFAMMWGDFTLETGSLGDVQKTISEQTAKGFVLIGRSHMDVRARRGGWAEYLQAHEDLLTWCRRNGVPIKTQRDWAKELYGGSNAGRNTGLFPGWTLPPVDLSKLPNGETVAFGENALTNTYGKHAMPVHVQETSDAVVPHGYRFSTEQVPFPTPNPWWMYSLVHPIEKDLNTGDLLLLAMRVKSRTPGAELTVQISGRHFGKQLFYHSENHPVDGTWKTLTVLCRVTAPTAAGQGTVLLNIGQRPTEMEVSGLCLLRFPPEAGETQVRDALITPKIPAPVPSKVWEAWMQDRRSGRPNPIPDYSHAGYRFGQDHIPDPKGPLFDVTRYGAKPDGWVNNRDAIQRAVDAAGAVGGGVVFFPPGTYWLNTDPDDRKSIWVTNHRIILRGSGMGKTVLRMGYHMYRKKPELQFPSNGSYNETTGNFLIQMGAPRSPWLRCGDETGGPVAPSNGTPRLATITGRGPRGTFDLEVDRTSQLKVGGWVVLYLRSKAWTRGEMPEETWRPEWTKIRQSGVINHQILQIESIQGNRVRFGQPLAWDVEPAHDWALFAWEPIEELGIEDLSIVGQWAGRFVHHRGVFDDSAYSGIQLNGAAHSWIRRVSFFNLSASLQISSSAAVSILLCRYGGNRGHATSVINAKNHGILTGLCLNEGGGFHGQDVAYWDTGTVFWRNTEGPDERQDIHMGHVHNTLFDCIMGGTIWGNGGNGNDGPHHMRGLTYWNFHLQRNESFLPTLPFDFWGPPSQMSTWALKPSVVGIHGRSIQFRPEQLSILESPGTPVAPESLFESQLAFRRGGVTPDWVHEARAGWTAMTQAALPAHLNYRLPDSVRQAPLYPQSVSISSLLERANAIEVGFFGTSNQFQLKGDLAGVGAIRTDLAFAEQCVFYLMSTLWGFSTRQNALTARRVLESGKSFVEISATTPTLETNATYTRFMDHAPGDYRLDWPRLTLLARRLGGDVGKVMDDSGTTVWLRLPDSVSVDPR